MFGRKSNSSKPKIKRADRLQSDFSAITSLFKAHPFISIKETFGVPAEKYLVRYKVEGLHLIGKAIEAKNEHLIEILLPPGYPDAVPVCKRVSPVFHPNFTSEMIDIKEYWSKDADAPLADLIVRIGEMIMFQKYSTANAINTEAGKWADRNTELLPLSNVDLRAHKLEPAPVTANADEKKADEKKAEQPVSDNIFVNEIVIQDEQQQDTTDPLDARKTEGITVNTDTAQLYMEQTADASPAPEKVPAPESKAPVPLPQQKNRDRPAVADAPKTEQPQSQNSTVQAVAETPAPDALPEQKTVAPQMVLFQFFYCPYCGNKNNKDANFCMNCGARLKPMKKRNTAKAIFIISMIAVPVVILVSGITVVIVHAVRQTPKTVISVPVLPPPPQPEQQKPLVPQPEPEAALPEKKAVEKTITAATVAQKMLQPKTGTGRLTEQQKNEKIADLLHNAKLYLNIGSYDDAIKRYREVLKLNPTNFEASVGLDSAQEARDKAPPRPSSPPPEE
jgi:hypothetical protein